MACIDARKALRTALLATSWLSRVIYQQNLLNIDLLTRSLKVGRCKTPTPPLDIPLQINNCNMRNRLYRSCEACNELFSSENLKISLLCFSVYANFGPMLPTSGQFRFTCSSKCIVYECLPITLNLDRLASSSCRFYMSVCPNRLTCYKLLH